MYLSLVHMGDFFIKEPLVHTPTTLFILQKSRIVTWWAITKNDRRGGGVFTEKCYLCNMKKLLLILSLILLCSQSIPLRYRALRIPDEIPGVLSDVYSLDTLLSGYWTIRTGEKEIYPTIVAYRVQEDMGSYVDWPSIETALTISKQYFGAGVERAKRDSLYGYYYEDKYIRVFVKER